MESGTPEFQNFGICVWAIEIDPLGEVAPGAMLGPNAGMPPRPPMNFAGGRGYAPGGRQRAQTSMF